LEEEGEDDFVDELKDALEKCQQSIMAESEMAPERSGMGTTLTMAYVVWPRLYIVHAGDSRCYLYRNSKLRQMTRDHTVAQKFVEAGMLTEEEAEESRWINILWNCVGGADEVRPEVYRVDLTVGDCLLLCSDGLTKELADEQIAGWLADRKGAETACQQLIEAANQAGGSDNITVVVARFQRLDEEAEFVADAASLQESLAEEDELTDTQVLPPGRKEKAASTEA
jgi:protein phosphatase